MRLETVVVGGIAGYPIKTRQLLELADILVRLGKERLFHQDMLRVIEQIGERLDLWFVWNAYERCIILLERHILDPPIAGFGVEWVHNSDDISARKAVAL